MQRVNRLFLIYLALLAFGLRSLVPVGYMPDFSGTGKGLFPIMLCDGMEHHHAGHHHHPDSDHHDGSCPFAASAMLASGNRIAPLLVHAVYAFASPLLQTSQLSTSPLDFGNVSPRSPPFFS